MRAEEEEELEQGLVKPSSSYDQSSLLPESVDMPEEVTWADWMLEFVNGTDQSNIIWQGEDGST
jgi:hypothetical protein